MKKEFHQLSYLAQVRRLRLLAHEALTQFPIKLKHLYFIHHGENTTFRVMAKNGQSYLLRLHRHNYHSKSAILEELNWLSFLSQKGLPVPKPVHSHQNLKVVTSHHNLLPHSRHCTLLEWTEGRRVGMNVSPSHLFKLGQLTATLHKNTPRSKVMHRRYWSAEGLLGDAPKFGSLDHLNSILPSEQKQITGARKKIFKQLHQFEVKFPERQSLIHADLHFGNLLLNGQNLGAIDFDDCGFGFHAYDLAVPIISAGGLLGESKQNQLPKYKEALLNGYSSLHSWDSHDEKILDALIIARRLTMLGWLNSRSDNPRLKNKLRGAVDRFLTFLNDRS